jgi:cytosine/uracil/thiamine/allantoin permease
MSNVTSRPMENDRLAPLPTNRTRVPRGFGFNRVVAIFLWSIACITTHQLVSAIRPDLDWRARIAIALAAQIVFTWLERPTLIGRPNKVSFAVLFLDTLINAGGIYPMALRAPETPPAQMLIQAFSLNPTISPLGGALLSLVFGFLLAASPEAVWRWKE